MDRKNYALNTNSLLGRKFPISVILDEEMNTYLLSLSPISLYEVIDILHIYGTKYYGIYGIDHYQWNSESNKLLTLKEIILQDRIEADFINDETAIITPKQLTKFLMDLSHYNFKIVGYNSIPDEIDIIENQLESYRILRDGGCVITELNGELFVSSHDDCYCYIECKSIELVKHVIGRLIKHMIYSFDKNINTESIHVDESIFNFVISNKTLTIIETEATDISNKWLVYRNKYPFTRNEDKVKEFENSIHSYLLIDKSVNTVVKLTDFT